MTVDHHLDDEKMRLSTRQPSSSDLRSDMDDQLGSKIPSSASPGF